MKTLIKIIVLAVVCLLSSCESEDQKVIEQLSGDWTITDIQLIAPNQQNSNLDFPTSGEISFGNCDLSESEYSRCTGS